MHQRARKLNRLLPLVAIGTIADCQSILEPTNRLLVRMGLRIMQSGQSGLAGLDCLTTKLGIQEKMRQGYYINSQDLAFYYSPILNSSGRMSHARLSISVLLADRENKKLPFAGSDSIQGNCASLADELIATNERRKKEVAGLVKDLDSQAQDQVMSGSKMIWLEESISKGIIGLIASRLVAKYKLPTIVVSKKPELTDQEIKLLKQIFTAL